jgi:hypothetical protein
MACCRDAVLRCRIGGSWLGDRRERPSRRLVSSSSFCLDSFVALGDTKLPISGDKMKRKLGGRESGDNKSKSKNKSKKSDRLRNTGKNSSLTFNQAGSHGEQSTEIYR